MFQVTTLFFGYMRCPESVTDDMHVAYYKTLEFLQEELKSRGTKFLGGGHPGYVDYMIWPWFERILTMDGLDGRMAIDPVKYKLFVSMFYQITKPMTHIGI